MDAMAAAVTLTLAEAAPLLDPPMTEQQLQAIVRALGWHPDGHRYTGRAGRPTARYDATRLMQLHAAVAPFNDCGTLWACDSTARRQENTMAELNATMVRIPAGALIDGAVVELSQDADGAITAEVRIPAPVPEPVTGPVSP